MKLTGSQILIECLIAQGADTIFGFPGGAVINIFDALYGREDQIRVICPSHEQGGTHAADGYARATGRTGVMLATSGPGATNLVTGLATAMLDSVPLVAITGNVTKDLIGRDGFQEVDIVTLTNPVVKHNFLVQDASELPAIVTQAFTIANSGRKGPVLIDIPKDITAQVVEYAGCQRFVPRPAPKVSRDLLVKAAEIIGQGKRPLIYAGGGVTFSDASPLLLELAQRIDAPICVSMMGLSAVPYDMPSYLGMVGMHGTPAANLAMHDCDTLLAIGTRFSDRVTGDRNRFAQNARKIHLDIDASEASKNVASNLELVGDVNQVIPCLLELLEARQHPEWTEHVARLKTNSPLPRSRSPKLTPYDILRELRQAIGEDGIVVTDVGQHQMWTAQHYNFSRPRTFLSSCGQGTMGYGLGAAIGAKVGMPGRKVALVTGDGSFHMNMNELAVAVSHNLDITIVLFNNSVLGMVHQWQTIFHQRRYSYTELRRATDYMKLAEAFGGSGFVVRDKNDLPVALQKAMTVKGPCIIDCRIDENERVYPFIPPGGTAQDMIYYD